MHFIAWENQRELSPCKNSPPVCSSGEGENATWVGIMPTESERSGRTMTEEFEIAGSELVDSVKELIAEGNVRRLIIRKPSGEVILEAPLTAGVVVGGIVTIYAPLLAALGAMAALLSEVKVDIIRFEDEKPPKKT